MEAIFTYRQECEKPTAERVPETNPVREKMGNKKIYIGAFCLFVFATGCLCYAGFSENSAYFLNVSEAAAIKPENLAKARLFGVVAPNTITRNKNTLQFNLADKDIATMIMPVSYTGIIPDNFRDGAEVIVEGGLDSQGRFFAKTLMTKCPSKYQKENRAAASKTL